MEGLRKTEHDPAQLSGNVTPRFFPDAVGDAVERLGDGAGDGGDGIAVSADADGFADAVFKGRAVQEAGQRGGHGALAGFREVVVIPQPLHRGDLVSHLLCVFPELLVPAALVA